MQDVIIYTTVPCPYCTSAKNLFQSLNIPFEEINIDSQPELGTKLSAENGGWRTFPMIFVKGKFLGGFTDVRQLHLNGGLLPLLQ